MTSDDDNENYTSSSNESCSEDNLDGFIDEIEMGEILNSREPFLTEYPTRDKVLVIFPLDGNVLDSDGNQFEFADDYKAIRRLGKVPKERESCVALIGDGKEQLMRKSRSVCRLKIVEENDLKAYDTSNIASIEESKCSDEREGEKRDRMEESEENIFKEIVRGSFPDVEDMTQEKGKLSKILFNKVNQKSSRQKEKKVAKKRQNQKKKLQECKSQIDKEERKKASSAKVKLLRTEEEENEINAQADDLSSCDPIDEKLWGFCDDEDVVERENFDEDKESCESNHTNENETTEKSLRNCNDLQPDTSSDDDLLPLNVSRKRKSAAYESFEESEQGPPMKKIRKSRRLEEKRLARLAKTKID